MTKRVPVARLFKGLLSVFFLVIFAQANAYELMGRIVKVADGDTLTLLQGNQQHRIRLASIDAPETSHGSDRPGQPFGEASRQYLASLVAGKTMMLNCFERDKYGREVCDIPLEGTTANKLMVLQGFAWANQQGHGKYLRDATLPAAQSQAQSARMGLWAEPNPIAPWIWRYRCWKQHQC